MTPLQVFSCVIQISTQATPLGLSALIKALPPGGFSLTVLPGATISVPSAVLVEAVTVKVILGGVVSFLSRAVGGEGGQCPASTPLRQN